MDFITNIFPLPTLQALGWTVIHSIWQAFVVAMLLAAYLLGWQKKNARHRYLAANLALGAVLILACITFTFLLHQVGTPESFTGHHHPVYEITIDYNLSESPLAMFQHYFSENMPAVVVIWLAGLIFFLLKMIGGLLYIQRLKRRYISELPPQWHLMLHNLAEQLRLQRQVDLAASALVKVPMVLGWLKPVILMPIGAVNNLTSDQVEAILAHELAHISRHDYLLNLLQSLIEILFYFNPAVWWISNNIRTERENCCDDIAVELCGNHLIYAKALVSLQETRYAAPAFAMPFSNNKGQLLTRIQRILKQESNKSNAMEKLTATFMLLAAVVLLSVQANTPFGQWFDKLNKGHFKSEAPDLETKALANLELLAADTIPFRGKGNYTIRQREDEKDIEVELKDGVITRLKIDGEEVPEESFSQYEGVVEELIESMPEPPLPPMVPMAPMAPAAPMAPFAPEPMLPVPPAPSVPENRSRKIVTEKNGNGTTIIIESTDGGEPIKIEMKDGKNGAITINGQEIKGMKKGDKTVILEKMEAAPGAGIWQDGDGRYGYHFDMEALEELSFPHEVYAFEMPEIPNIDLLLDEIIPSGEWKENNQQWLKEYEERLKDGNLNREWAQELNQRLKESYEPEIFKLNELRSKADKEMERALEQSMKEQQFHLQRAQEMHQHELEKLLHQQELRQEQRAKERAHGRRLIRLKQDDGSM